MMNKMCDLIINRSQISSNTVFFKKTIEYLKNIKNIQKLEKTHKIDDGYIFEPLKLYLYDRFDDYVCFITNRHIIDTEPLIMKYCLIRDLSSISHKALRNLLRQFNAIEMDNPDALINNNNIYENIESLVFVVTTSKNNEFNMEVVFDNERFVQINKPSSLNLFLGIEALNFLHHQNLDRFVNYMKSTKKEIIASTKIFTDTYNLFKNLDQDRTNPHKKNISQRIIMYSGFVSLTLGTSYTSDADIIFWAKGLDKTEIEYMNNLVQQNDIFDYSVYFSDDQLKESYIGEIVADPELHYYFMGIKIINVQSYINRLYKRASAVSYVDILMLNEINNYNIKPCIPVITFKDKAIVFTEERIQKLLREIQRLLKSWHYRDYSYDRLKKIFTVCEDYIMDPPFYREIVSNDLTEPIDQIHHSATLELINKYFLPIDNKKTNILIIDDSREFPRFYPIQGHDFRIVVSEPEPRLSSKTQKYISMAEEKKITDFSIIPGDLSQSGEGERIIKNNQLQEKFKYILFNHTIGMYFDNSIDEVVKNISTLCCIDALIIVPYIDGEMLKNKMHGSDRYEIVKKTKYDPIHQFGVYQYNKSDRQKIVIYLADTPRYGSGVVQSMITYDFIKMTFSDNFDVINDGLMIDLLSNQSSIVKNLTDIQKQILQFFKYVILKQKPR
jgi:hypothetical protein